MGEKFEVKIYIREFCLKTGNSYAKCHNLHDFHQNLNLNEYKKKNLKKNIMLS